MIKKVLCICLGNSDRSPFMAEVLKMYLKNAGHDVQVESAGISEPSKNGGPASPNCIISAKRLGLDLSAHERRWVGSLDLRIYDLFVSVDRDIARELLTKYNISLKKICNMQIHNPWPSSDRLVHDATAEDIMGKMFRVITLWFSKE